MSIPLPLASLRATLKQHLARLCARPIEGGPFSALREGEVIVFGRESIAVVLTREHVERLAKLPDGAGPEAVWSALEQPLHSPPSPSGAPGPVSSGAGPGIAVEDKP